MYIPVYDTDGSLLLNPESFDDMRADGNYDVVKPEIVDNSFKRQKTQKGSNEGAWFVLPKNNEVENWYVKFGDSSQEKTAHTWNELLADELYRRVVPELVPATKALIVDGRFARGSKQVEVDESIDTTNEARNQGAVMVWYLGNWDAVYNKDNIVMSQDGLGMRIDTGNTLDFKARGDKKEPDAFGPIVYESE